MSQSACHCHQSQQFHDLDQAVITSGEFMAIQRPIGNWKMPACNLNST